MNVSASPVFDCEAFLKQFHADHPSCTPNAFASGRAESGESSYELLTNLAPSDQTSTILDLACGDGYLLSLLHAHPTACHRLIGIDLSSGELAVARRRFVGTGVTLHQARAQALPLADASVDLAN